LFKHEFRFQADASFDEIFERTTKAMSEAGDLTIDSESVAAGPGRDGWTGHQWLMTYTSFLRNFVESYRIAARGLHTLLDEPLAEKDLLKHALTTGTRMYLAGEIDRREAISKLVIGNALTSFFDLGYLVKPDGKFHLAEGYDLDAVRNIERKIAFYLDRTGDA
jgi:glycerol-3-phosphate O-acyltransferase